MPTRLAVKAVFWMIRHEWNMQKSLVYTFLRSEGGAVTVDFIVITGAIVGLGIAVIANVRAGVTNLATSVETSLSSASVAALGTLGASGLDPAACSSGDPDPDGNNCSITTPTRR
jgi:hypothetical protein